MRIIATFFSLIAVTMYIVRLKPLSRKLVENKEDFVHDIWLKFIMQTINIRKLSKNYSFKTAVKNLDIQLERGTLFGFVGPNGAGKTTMVNMLAGILPPTSGITRLLGLDFEQ